MKAFIEAEFDINILLDNKFEKSHENVKWSLISIFNNQKTDNKVFILFYYNDYIHYNKINKERNVQDKKYTLKLNRLIHY